MDHEELTVASSVGEYSRSAWLITRAETDRLCIFLDGELTREKLDPMPILTALTQAGLIPSMTVVFVSHGGAEARHTDYVCNPAFARFIAEDVVNQVRAHVPTLADHGHLICGVSLSGLAAAHLALLYPRMFPAALCQSGSFWFEPGEFAQLIETLPPAPTRFWLSVGDEETDVDVSHPPTGLYQGLSQIAGVELARKALASSGRAVRLNTYHGGHAFEPWREELDNALQWLLRPMK